MSFLFPVTIDQELLAQYREELQWANQEVEALAIKLERNPQDMYTAQKIRNIIKESWLNSEKLELIPLSESLDDTLKGLDLLLDWQVYPPGMTDFVLLLIDRVMEIAREAEETQFIDMRKTQAILVALQYIILAQSVDEITQGIEHAIVSINREIGDNTQEQSSSDEVDLFDDGVDLFDGGVDLFDAPSPGPAFVNQPAVDIFVPQATLNPLNVAREYIQGQSKKDYRISLGQISDHATQHYSSHTHFLLELSLAMNIMAGEPLDFASLYKGICLHDIALASSPDLLFKKGKLSQADIDELRLHPVTSAKVAHELSNSNESEFLVLHHHERIDGSGYPFGLKGDNISEQGKLAAIVDAFHNAIEQHACMGEREYLNGYTRNQYPYRDTL